MKNKINLFITTLVAIYVMVACKSDFLNTTSTQDTSYSSAISTPDNLMLIINGIHRDMYTRTPYGQGYNGQTGVIVLFDSMADDLVHTGTGLSWHISSVRWQTQNVDSNGDVAYPWRFYYKIINNANIVIENGPSLTVSNSTEQTTKDKAIGEAYAYRAWCFLQMVQLYGNRYITGTTNSQDGVILRLKEGEEAMARSSVEQVYTQIHADLDKAISYLTGKTALNKSHFSVSVAQGLKARAYLVQGNWPMAANFAKLARTGSGITLMSNAQYLSGFNDFTNAEWMWGSHIDSDQTDYFGNFGAYMSRNYNSSTIRTAPKAIYVPLFNKFPATDVRTKNFDPTGLHTALSLPTTFTKKPYTSQKFLAVSDTDSRCDVPYMRAGEMYLIEAEALARAGNEAGSRTVYNAFMLNRNPSYVASTNTGTAYINEILDSRRLELWGEGFRWFDLKRLNLPLVRNDANTNHVPSVINSVWTVPASDKRWTLKIPLQEMQTNKLCTQND